MSITLEKARELVEKYLKDKNNRIHSLESEVVMQSLAKHFGEDEAKWAIAGLLHDLDWENTLDNFEQHGLQTIELIEKEGYELPDDVVHAISAHNESHTGIRRESKIDYALAAAESITGLIYAYALMRPEKLQGMKASSLNKKFKDKSFAANVSRELIEDIEKTGLEKSKFFEIAIQAMQSIALEIDL
ncbi:MAG: HD domain-containing protein [Parcubacteria group bacterium]|nr:HD domain-containing protein [Parcubacteria group bacterium]